MEKLKNINFEDLSIKECVEALKLLEDEQLRKQSDYDLSCDGDLPFEIILKSFLFI